MRKKSLLFPLITILLGISGLAHAQQWAGVLDPSRAVDWSNAGVSTGIAARTTNCATLNPGATAAQINSAISSCASGQTVFLNAGTYNLSSGISFIGKNNVTLRGAGADQTKLVFSGSFNCRGFSSSICLASSNNPGMPSPSNSSNWTAGYAKGTTTLTFSSTSGMAVGSVLILDQADDSSDTGGIYVCSSAACAGEGGNSYGRKGRAQQQLVKITTINGNNVTITPGLYMPNWSSSKSPGATWASGGMSGNGVENLSLDSNNSGGMAAIVLLYVTDCWVKGVKSTNANRSHVWLYQTAHSTVRDSYFYGTQNSASQSYGVEAFSASDNLVENNIFQHVTGPITVNGADSGSVWAYNYAIDDNYSVSANWMIPSIIAHESGIAMDLFEGNDGLGFEGDDIHGTHHFLTAYRNYLYGDTYNNPAKSNNTAIIHLWAFNRYFNIVGNVLGRTGYYNTYEQSLGGGATTIFAFGGGGGSPNNPPDDPLVETTVFRWGNYDTVSGAARFVGSEVPSVLSQFKSLLPGSQSLPASFYLDVKPSWWGSGAPWPGIGPDVTGGPGPAGHAYNIPAKACYNSTSKTSNILNFNAANCYGSSAGGTTPPPNAPNPPTSLGAVVQ